MWGRNNFEVKSTILLTLLSLGGGCLARRLPGFANFYSHHIYRYTSLLFSEITGLLPFSVVELLLYSFILYIFIRLLRGIRWIYSIIQQSLTARKHTFPHEDIPQAEETWPLRAAISPSLRAAEAAKQSIWAFSELLLLCSVLFFLYTFQCGINYYRDSFSKEAGIVTRDYTTAELREVTEILVQEVTELRTEISAVQDSPDRSSSAKASAILNAYYPVDAPIRADFLYAAGREGQKSMKTLGESYPRLKVRYPFPKPLLLSRILTVQQLTGVYSPFTVEANYNREMPRYNLPFTICHELSHLAGYMQEEEANFIAFLACRGSNDLYFRYSAALSGFVYVGNELARVDPVSYTALYQSLPESVKAELNYERDFWDLYESKISEAAEQRNDAYLKANGQSSGTRSYGQAAELIMWYYLH